MTAAAHPVPERRSLLLPAARRSRTAMSSQTSAEPLHASSPARASRLCDRTSSSSSFRSTRSPPCRSRAVTGAPSANLKSRRFAPYQSPSSPRFRPWEAFERRPRIAHGRPGKGRRPKPSYEGRQVKRQVLVSVNSDYQTGRAPCQPRIRRDPAIPNHDPCIREKEFLAAGPIFTSAP